MTLRTPSQPPIENASSIAGFSAIALPPRICSSAAITRVAPASTTRSCTLFAEKPPNTTEWVMPSRAHACIATTASIDIGM